MRKHLPRALAATAFLAGALLVPATASAASPSNDDFANATLIDPSSLPFSDVVDNTQATTEPGEPADCIVPPVQQTVWYAITPTVDGTLQADTVGSNFSTFLEAFQSNGPGFGGLSSLVCQFFGTPITFTAHAGTTYYFQVGSFPFSSGGDLHLNLRAIPAPANDDFANATVVDSLPFSDSVDTTAATVESNEPTPSCGFGQSTGTVWFAFTPPQSGSYTASAPNSTFSTQVAAYTGSGLGSVSEIGCRAFGQPLTFDADAGTTYYVQVGGLFGGRGTLTFSLDVAPNPVAQFFYSPGDPSAYDIVQFFDNSYDPGGNSFTSKVWHFGDGTTTTNPGCCVTHRYAADRDYTVELDVTTTDGRTASTQQVVHVKTHDVSIAKVLTPQTASVGQTRTITVGITNNRYPETVQVQLSKSVAGGGWQPVGVLTQYVPVRGASRTTNFNFSYTFAPEDASLGKINFQAVATIQGARDAIPSDNSFTSLSTKVVR
jgi:PKD domain